MDEFKWRWLIEMDIKNPHADLISDYLKEHKKNAYLGRQEPYEIAGKRVSLDVIRLPNNLLYYNIGNGRFAAELHEFEASEGCTLKPEKPKDALKIEDLLLKDKTKTERTEWLKKDLARVGRYIRLRLLTMDISLMEIGEQRY